MFQFKEKENELNWCKINNLANLDVCCRNAALFLQQRNHGKFKDCCFATRSWSAHDQVVRATKSGVKASLLHSIERSLQSRERDRNQTEYQF